MKVANELVKSWKFKIFSWKKYLNNLENQIQYVLLDIWLITNYFAISMIKQPDSYAINSDWIVAFCVKLSSQKDNYGFDLGGKIEKSSNLDLTRI